MIAQPAKFQPVARLREGQVFLTLIGPATGG
jgi:hypothetical protein